ncbi:MAG: type II toxin-antitoxin system VapC family toxin [Verrucomicrobiota bacterium]
MRYLLDTNICVFLIRNRSPRVLAELRKHDPADLCISAITVAELEYGCDRSADPGKNHLALTEFLSPFTLLPFDEAAACVYGRVRIGLEKVGTPIGSMDLLIAAHAVSRQMTVVTNNTREFNRVEGLVVEDWSQ